MSKDSHCVIALDGEREITVSEDDRISIRLNLNGLRVLSLTETLRHASNECVFIADQIAG